jgi:hypothetical protein
VRSGAVVVDVVTSRVGSELHAVHLGDCWVIKSRATPAGKTRHRSLPASPNPERLLYCDALGSTANAWS